MPTAILLRDVDNLGERGTVVDVSKGFLRNYLIPRKLAQPATPASIEAARRQQEAADRAVAEARERAKEQAETLTKTVLTIPAKAGPDGRLYGSVTAEEISEAIRDARGIRIDKRKVILVEPIRHVGTYLVQIELAEDAMANVKTMVVESQ
jgi:large subunit ribosomal protein L9